MTLEKNTRKSHVEKKQENNMRKKKHCGGNGMRKKCKDMR